MIGQKRSISDYTQAEFRMIVEELIQAAGTSAWQDRLLEHFIDVVEHPAGSDLIYHPASEAQGCAGQVIADVVAWRRSQGLPVFRDGG